MNWAGMCIVSIFMFPTIAIKTDTINSLTPGGRDCNFDAPISNTFKCLMSP